MLDLTLAYNTVTYDIILSRLEKWVGLKSIVLQRFCLYLSWITFYVNMGLFSSEDAPLSFGVPQASILAPGLLALYMLPLVSIFQNDKLSFHCFSDDFQIYFFFKCRS